MKASSELSFYLETYGCQMNVSDSNIIRNLLVNEGFEETTSPTNATVVILNTCAVRDSAEQRIIGRLGTLLPKNKENKAIVVLTGCMAQDSAVELASVDLVIGTHYKTEIGSIIKNYIKNADKKRFLDFDTYKFVDAKPEKEELFKASVNIIHGCNNSCSYCIVPFTRGIEISRPSKDIVENVRNLVNDGVVEIILLGQNVLAYGRDCKEISFSELLIRLNDIKGLKRIRFLSPHPKDFSEEVIKTISNLPAVCKLFHIPLQSASNKVLERMERNHTFEDYLKIIYSLRELIPDCAISTDIIAGFPGETENDFMETYNAIEKIRFDFAYMFKYSPRSFTKAEKFQDVISEEEKLFRLDKIIQLQLGITREILEAFVGTSDEILCESLSRKNKQEVLGKTGTNRSVIIKGDNSMIGMFKNVKLVELSGHTFKGEIIN